MTDLVVFVLKTFSHKHLTPAEVALCGHSQVYIIIRLKGSDTHIEVWTAQPAARGL